MTEPNPKLRRRRRSRRDSDEMSVSPPEPAISAKPTESNDITEVEEEFIMKTPPKTPPVFNSFNNLRSEFMDSQRNSLIEDEYSDDTHDWLDYSSPEYANFLGSYE